MEKLRFHYLNAPSVRLTAGRYLLHEADREKTDVEALLSFRQDITSDPLGSLSHWSAANSDNVCRWNGISCRHETKRVIAIQLSHSSLQGMLSTSIGNLSLLRSLDLSLNHFTGRIPHELGRLKALFFDLSPWPVAAAKGQ